MNIDINLFKKMFAAAYAEIVANELKLCELDSVCGDGDHGVAIKGALGAAEASLNEATDLKEGLYDAGVAAMSHSNGSTSTLFGSLLMGLSDGIEDGVTEVDAAGFASLFKAGLESVSENTAAKVGDKTLMDALIPAVEAMEGKASLAELLEAAAAAAKAGSDNTTTLQAKFGRARNLGEKSIGSIDAGSVSISIIFAQFAKVYSQN
ncbi:MAG: DAK2 domain-containing protein [Opitutales bacterium]